MSLITNISFDHTQFLGNTLEQIAAEKAGIIKQHVPVVIGETVPETRTVFKRKAAICKAPIYFAEEEPEVLSSKVCQTGGRDYFTQNFGNLHGQLGGEYQERNANTVLKALSLLQEIFNITPNNIVRGFANVTTLTGLRGRWEKLRENPVVICDTGHNVAGWKWLAPQIKSAVCRKLRLIFGMVDDKDVETIIKLLPKNATYYWAQASTKRAIPSNIIAEMGRKNQLVGTDCGTVAEAYHKAITDASADDFIFVGGSSYIVSDLLLLKDF